MTKFLVLVSTCVALLGGAPAWATDLSAPTERVVLTVSGEITRTNGDGVAKFDLAMLRDIDATEVKTTTIWTDGPQVFVGVSLDVLLDSLGAQGATIAASAINDYTVEIPFTDAVQGGPILAYERNGAEMSRRDKGPLWVVYPYDSSSEYRTEVIYSRSIWQLDRLSISK